MYGGGSDGYNTDGVTYADGFYDQFVNECLGGYYDNGTVPSIGLQTCNITTDYSRWPDRCAAKIRSGVQHTHHEGEPADAHASAVPVLVYARIYCQAVEVNLGFMTLTRQTVSIVVVCIDLSCIFAF